MVETIKMTTAQALIKFLNQQYVELDGQECRFVRGIFTIFGHGNVLGLGQALEEDPGHLEVYQGHNEQGMAQSAIAFAKQSYRKQIYACTSSIGPGAANMVTAAATATANNIPVLLLPGDTFSTRQPDPVLQQVEQTYNLSITTNDAFKAVSKYWDRVNRPEQLMTAMINAMRVLTDPANTGAVTIALPQDVQGEVYDFPEYFFKKRVHRIERTPPSKQAIEDAVELIKRKKKPLIICGGGVRYSEAAESLKRFSEEFNIPFGETQAGKSAIEWSYELNLGGIGVTGNSAANSIAKDADLIIGVGTRFTDFTTCSKFLFQNEDVEFLTINISNFHANKLDAVKVISDAKVGLDTIANELEKQGYTSAYKDEIKKAKNEWKKELNRLFNIEYTKREFVPEIAGHCDEVVEEFYKEFDSCLTQTKVLGEINELLDDDAIVIGASGSLPGDLHKVWCPKKSNTYHVEYGYSCMGYEVSAALGVKLAEEDKEVYSLVGDGAYLMLHSELITSIKEGKKINVLLFDNAGFGCINNLQMSNGMGSFATEFRHRNNETGKLDGKLLKIDFAKSAEGYGVKTYKVNTIDKLKYAIEDSKKQKISTLIDIKVLPKTMTGGYESWWHVGVSEKSKNPKINKACESKINHLAKARKY